MTIYDILDNTPDLIQYIEGFVDDTSIFTNLGFGDQDLKKLFDYTQTSLSGFGPYRLENDYWSVPCREPLVELTRNVIGVHTTIILRSRTHDRRIMTGINI